MSARRYRICGAVLETAWPLVTHIPQTDAPPDLRFIVSDEAPARIGEPVEHQFRLPDGRVYLALGTRNGHEVLRFPPCGDAWFIGPDTIVFHLQDPASDYQVEIVLLGILMATWLERRGMITLHGSAATDNGGAIGFLGPNGAGKTSLSLEIVREGGRLVTDDLLVVEIHGSATAVPSFPQVRLWPDDARRFRGSTDGLHLAHPSLEKLRIPLAHDEFAGEPAPLQALYLPRKDETASDVRIEVLSGPVALFSLLLTTFAIDLVDIPEHRPAWIRRIGTLLDHVPVHRLIYPDARDFAPHVAALVREHAASLRSVEPIGRS